MKRKTFALTLALLLLAALLGGCAASGTDSSSQTTNDSVSWTGEAVTEPSVPDMAPEENGTAAETTGEGAGLDASAAETERKIIQNADFSLETLNYDQTVADIETLVEMSGGYIESSQTTGSGATGDYYRARWASFTVRVPAEGLQDFGDALSECGSVTSSYYYTEEVTDYYYDTEAHLRSLELQEERLLEILSKAEQLSEVIELENSLANVRYQIESLQGTLRRLDSQVALSTVNISVQEVYEYSPEQGVPKGLGERIANEFSRSMASMRRTAENIIVFVAGNIVGLVLLAAVVAGVIVLIRRRLRKKRAQQPQETTETDKKE